MTMVSSGVSDDSEVKKVHSLESTLFGCGVFVVVGLVAAFLGWRNDSTFHLVNGISVALLFICASFSEVDKARTFKFTSPKIPYLDAALLSSLAYLSTVAEISAKLCFSDWIVKDVHTTANGLSVAVFYSTKLNHTVFAFRGTCCRADITTDFQIAMDWPLNTFEQACEYFESQIVPLHDKERIVFVGHSLGGALASMMSLYYGHQAIVFDSPGSYGARTSKLRYFDHHKGLVHNIVGPPNLVNTCHKHVGTLMYIDTAPYLSAVDSVLTNGKYAVPWMKLLLGTDDVSNAAETSTCVSQSGVCLLSTLHLHRLTHFITALEQQQQQQVEENNTKKGVLVYVTKWCNVMIHLQQDRGGLGVLLDTTKLAALLTDMRDYKTQTTAFSGEVDNPHVPMTKVVPGTHQAVIKGAMKSAETSTVVGASSLSSFSSLGSDSFSWGDPPRNTHRAVLPAANSKQNDLSTIALDSKFQSRLSTNQAFQFNVHDWVVTLVNTVSSGRFVPGHAALTVEGRNPDGTFHAGVYHIKAELVPGMFAMGGTVTEVCVADDAAYGSYEHIVPDIRKLVERNSARRSFIRCASEVKRMIANIKSDHERTLEAHKRGYGFIPYHILGGPNTGYVTSKLGIYHDSVNCATWCVLRLRDAGIHLPLSDYNMFPQQAFGGWFSRCC